MIVQKTTTMVRSAIAQLHSIWTEVGYDKETQSAYTIAALDHIQVKLILNDCTLAVGVRYEARINGSKIK